MTTSVERAISRSAAAFRDVVWPEIRHELGDATLIPVESVSDSHFARCLDMQAGIDAWLLHGDTHMRGLASRVQWIWRSRSPFDTFTVRTLTDYGNINTEHRKRTIAIATPGAVLPYWTVQAFLREDTDDFLSVAVARTTDVIACVGHVGYETPNGHGGRMWVIPWQQLAGTGAPLVVVRAEDKTPARFLERGSCATPKSWE